MLRGQLDDPVRFQRYSTHDGLSHNTIRSIHQDRKGFMWLGTANSENIAIYKLFQDSMDRLWIGTDDGGLNRFDRGSETFVRYTEDQGLPDITVYGILEDELGCLWLSTNKGISCFNPETEEFRNYDTRDGLQDDEFNGGAYFRSPSGQMFFGVSVQLNSDHS